MKSKVSLEELPQFCRDFVKRFKHRDLVLLSGPLGAGKTQFVKHCLTALCGNSSAESPTFSIINEYGGAPPVFHVDLYRLESAADIESSGFWDLFANTEGVIFVEWPEQVGEEDFPVYWNKIKVQIQFTDEPNARTIEID
jgi:tRNA threonylcarbamoyladenosine biosynthesis protein TsaE